MVVAGDTTIAPRCGTPWWLGWQRRTAVAAPTRPTWRGVGGRFWLGVTTLVVALLFVGLGLGLSFALAGPQWVKLPNVINERQAVALHRLTGIGLRVGIASTFPPIPYSLQSIAAVPKYLVQSVDPSPGTRVRTGTIVVLWVWDPPPGHASKPSVRVSRAAPATEVSLPNLILKPQAKAVTELRRLGLNVVVWNDDLDPGAPYAIADLTEPYSYTVYAETPRPGTKLREGSTVRLDVYDPVTPRQCTEEVPTGSHPCKAARR